MDDFWTDLMFHSSSSLDTHLRDHQPEEGRGMRALTDRGRAAAALPLPVLAGTRVAFVTNLGSVLTYPDPPPPDAEGTVVMVRTAEGDQTGMNDTVFVKFDNGQFLAIHHEHLRAASQNLKVASSLAFRTANLGDLSGFLYSGSDEDNELVHKATKDLWSMQQTEEGDYVIARLFDDTGKPLKI